MITLLFNLRQDQSNQQVFIGYLLKYVWERNQNNFSSALAHKYSVENKQIMAYDFSSLSTSF